jgi:hypothetical protein
LSAPVSYTAFGIRMFPLLFPFIII